MDEVLHAPGHANQAILDGFHTPPRSFERGKPRTIEVSPAKVKISKEHPAIRLRYRRVNQGELWQVGDMNEVGNLHRGVIPGDYTDSPFPLQYHFEIHPSSGAPWLLPGLFRRGFSQPYFVVRQV